MSCEGNVLFQGVVDLDGSKGPVGPRLSRLMASNLSGALDWSDNPKKDELDPALGNSAARDFLRAGRELESRRTGADLDRAIDCYAKALRRSSPTPALIGAELVPPMVGNVNMGRSNAQLLAQAGRLGQEAIRLSPGLAEAHRALGGL